MESAKRVRSALAEFRPTAIVVEVPETLAQPFQRAVARLPLLSILRWREGDGAFAYFLVEPADPIVEAARFAQDEEAVLVCGDRHTEGYAGHADLVPDTWALERLAPAEYDALVAAGAETRGVDPEDERREATMAFHVRRQLDERHRVALVCGAAHAPRILALLDGPMEATRVRPLGRTRHEVDLFHLAEEASREVLGEAPFVQTAYWRWRTGAPQAPFSVEPARTGPRQRALPRIGAAAAPILRTDGNEPEPEPEPEPERYGLLTRLGQAARDRYLDEDGERITPSALAILSRLARNWSWLAGRLSPDLVELVTCARGVGGDDFAYRFWEVAVAWPWQSQSPGLPVLRPTVEELYHRAAHLRFRRSQKSRRHRLRLVPPRPREARPGEWKDEWKGQNIVSYPPEDLVLEGYGAFLKKRAVGILSAEQSRTAPLTTSLCDGVDLRETIRNLAHDGRIFVREERPVKGNVGAVVVVFDEDERGDVRYPWLMTWQGEHDDESDMALYSTAPGGKLVGPGISRCEYGGFLMTLPPGRMFSVWQDPFFERARTKPERLLLAGIDYSLERLVMYVAPKPPRSALTAHAARRGKKVVYVPLGQLSPIMLKKVRVFHVLDGRRVRAYAKDYIRS